VFRRAQPFEPTITLSSVAMTSLVATFHLGSADGIHDEDVAAARNGVLTILRKATYRFWDARSSSVVFTMTAGTLRMLRSSWRQGLMAAQASGQIAALDGEDGGSAYLAPRFHSTESRNEGQG
jgi:hypothetical protein